MSQRYSRITISAAVALTGALTAAAQLNIDSTLAEPTSSVLAEGDVYQLAVDADGVYRIDAELLRALGLDPDSADPTAIRLYSKGGAMLPELVGAPYVTDLAEVGLLEVGDGDASWDSGERLLFYGEGADTWVWNPRAADGAGDFARVEHLYDERTYYYLKVGGRGLRVAPAESATPAAYDDVYTARARHEVDEHNILQRSQVEYGTGQGSGQDWFGYEFADSRATDFELALDNVVADAGPGRLSARMVASAIVPGTRFEVDVAGESFTTRTVRTGDRVKPETAFAHFVTLDVPLQLGGSEPEVTVRYPGSREANRGWLDYVQVTHPARLRFDGAVLGFRSARHAAAGIHGFALVGGADARVLDISTPLQPAVVVGERLGEDLRFGFRQNELGAPREFVAFSETADLPRPTPLGPVRNTNLHAAGGAEMLIVYADTLHAAAERLAEHRRTHDGYRVIAARVSDVANEFGGGRADPSAIRALARMLRERDGALRFVLILGDGTYDHRGIDLDDPSALAPTYQTSEVTSEVNAFPTDDYYGLLDLGEGRRPGISYPRGDLDVGVGRIPAGDIREAENMVAKIIRYDTDPAMLGDWRLRTVFVADDQDKNRHVQDMDEIAEIDFAQAPEFNQVKVYADAFDQVATGGEQRFPAASEAINRNMVRGNLVTTYLGHGGPRGWAQERILNDPDIANWDNEDALTILITATCTFTGYDDPRSEVAGEKVLFKRDGGAVATLSTTRPVFISANRVLTENTHRFLLDDSVALERGIGEIMALAKNSSPNSQNDSKYSLFGDPAMKVAHPKLDVVVTAFDSLLLDVSDDTLAVPSLREVTIAGEVHQRQGRGLAEDFDGDVTLTIFDQERTGRTLGQDFDSYVREFRRSGASLFKGRASVVGGVWQARFMLPRDVSLGRGLGRLSLYAAADDGRDAAGVFTRFFVDGLAPPAVADDTPPSITVGIDDLDFVPGGVAGEDPELVIALTDDTGINISGISIGHDLTATLRGPRSETYVLNDDYAAENGDYGSGSVRYKLFDLPVGEYDVEVRAWDLANNTTTGTTSFIVLDREAGPGLRDVLAYPNPLTESTCFSFAHAAEGQEVEVDISIFSMTGELVRELSYDGEAIGTRFDGGDCVTWDGTDAQGGPLAQGIYLYRIALSTADSGAALSEFERIVVAR